MHDVSVIEDPAAAEISLDPIRARLLAELTGRVGHHAGRQGRAGPAEGQLSPARARGARAGSSWSSERRKGNMTERLAAGYRQLLRHLAGRSAGVGTRSGPGPRQAVGPAG